MTAVNSQLSDTISRANCGQQNYKCDIFSLKCTRIHPAARIRPYPLGVLKRSPRHPRRYKGKGPPEGKGGAGEGAERGRDGT